MDASENQVFFLLTVGITTSFLFAVRAVVANQRIKKADKAKLAKRVTIAFGVVGLVLVLEAAGVVSLFHNRDRNGLIFSVMLALACGFAIYSFATTSQSAKTMTSGGWIVLIVLSFSVGLFWERLPFLLSSVTSAHLETSVGKINLSFSDLAKETKGIDIGAAKTDRRDGKTLFERKTNYQLGSNMLLQTQARIPTDFERIGSLCSVAAGSSTTTISAERCNDLFAATLQALSKDRKYSDVLRDVARCMTAHANFFPNGLPAHTTLLNVALNMAKRPVSPASSDGAPEALDVPAVSDGAATSKARLTDGAASAEVREINHRPDSLFEASANDRSDSNSIADLINQIQQANRTAFNSQPTIPVDADKDPCAVLDTDTHEPLRNRASGFDTPPSMRTPHRTVTESAFIVAAGFPYDGAKRIEAEYHSWTQRKLRYDNPTEERVAVIVDSLMRLRFLAMLDQIYDQIDEKKRSIQVLNEMGNVYNRLFEAMIGEAQTLSELLIFCAKEEFSETLIDGNSSESYAFRNYFRSLLWSAITTEVRRWQKQRGQFLAENELVGAVARLETLVAIGDSTDSYEACLTPWLAELAQRAEVALQVDTTLFELSDSTVNLIQVILNQQIDSFRKLDEVMDRSLIRTGLCTARNVMLRVGDLAVRLDKMAVAQQSAWPETLFAPPAQDRTYVARLQDVIHNIRDELDKNYMECDLDIKIADLRRLK